MNCQDITKALLNERYRRHFVLPRYTPSGWFECDVFELTKAGYFREYEVKTSVSDFHADALKVKTVFDVSNFKNRFQAVPQATKHQRLMSGDPAGPTEFYFVIPKNLVPLFEIPEWAGVIEGIKRSNDRLMFGPILSVVRSPTRLHNDKADPKIREHAEGVCYWRLLNHLTGHNTELKP